MLYRILYNLYFFLILLTLSVRVTIASSTQGNNTCFQIDRIEIKGVKEISPWQIKEFKKGYEKKCLYLKDIQEIHKKLSNRYIKDGYINARVHIPEQDLNRKKLIIEVREGKIAYVEDTKGAKLKGNNLPVLKGRALNLRDIEQGVDLLNRLKSNNAKIYLKPGSKPGESVVVVDNKQSKRWHFSTGIDNAGSKSKGIYQNFSNVTLENLLGLQEYYLFGYRKSLGPSTKGGTHSYTGIVMIPYGYNNFTLSYNRASYRNFIKGRRNNQYKNSGGSKVLKLNIDRVIHRDTKSKTIFSFGLGHDDYSNYVAEHKIEMVTYRMHKFDAGFNHQRRLQGGALSFGASFTAGENQNYSKKFGSVATPEKHFYKIDYEASWHKALPIKLKDNNLKYHFKINGQLTPKLLVATEKDTVGGLSSVRGFKSYTENADNTLVIRNELSLGLPGANTKATKMLFGENSIFSALDIGTFKNYEEQDSRDGMMAGVAIGIKSSGGFINFDVTLGLPLRSPENKKRSPILYFNIKLEV